MTVLVFIAREIVVNAPSDFLYGLRNRLKLICLRGGRQHLHKGCGIYAKFCEMGVSAPIKRGGPSSLIVRR